jgi:integrase
MRKPKPGRLKLKRRQGSEFWQVAGTIGGERFRRSTETADKDLADELRVKWEREAQEKRVNGDKIIITFESAVAMYLDVKGDHGGRFLAPVLDHFGITPIHTITSADIMGAAANIYPGRAPATINRQLIAPASAVINNALDMHHLPAIRYKRLPEPPGRKLWLTPEIAEKVITACADYPMMQAYVLFLLGTGARRRESLKATVRDFHLGSREVAFYETKTDDPRLVPYPERTAAALRAIDLSDLTQTPFRDERGRAPIWNARDRTAIYESAFAKRMTDLNLDGVSWHTLRHTWATWWYASNLDLLRLMMLGGWERSETAQRYAKMAPADLPDQLSAFGWDFGTKLTHSNNRRNYNAEK